MEPRETPVPMPALEAGVRGVLAEEEGVVEAGGEEEEEEEFVRGVGVGVGFAGLVVDAARVVEGVAAAEAEAAAALGEVKIIG